MLIFSFLSHVSAKTYDAHLCSETLRPRGEQRSHERQQEHQQGLSEQQIEWREEKANKVTIIYYYNKIIDCSCCVSVPFKEKLTGFAPNLP